MTKQNSTVHLYQRLSAFGASLLITASFSYSQHGIADVWGSTETQVTHDSGYSGGVVGRNIAVDSQNRIHVVYVNENGSSINAYYTRSVDGGLTWEQPRRLTNSPLNTFSPNLSVGRDDTLHATWLDPRNGGGLRVFYARSFDAGLTWESPRDISGPAPYSAASALVSVDLRNRVHVAWHIGNPDSQQQIAQAYYTRSVNGGQTFEPPRRLNTDPSHHAAFPRFTVSGTLGDIVAIAWRDNRRNPDWDTYIAVSQDGGQTFVERIGRATPLRDWDPEVMVDRQDVIHLSYMTYRGSMITIDYLRSTDFGQTWSPEVTLSEARSRFPFWAYDARHDILWLFLKDERDVQLPNFKADIACKFSRNGGRTWSPQEFVTDMGDVEVKFPGVVSGPDGRVYAIWSDRRESTTSEQLYFKARSPLGDVNLDGCVDDADLLSVLFEFGQSGSGLTADVDGNQVVDDHDLLIVLFNTGVGC